jgi:hypothetical protein
MAFMSVFAGCTSNTPPQSNSKQLPVGTYSYQLNVANIRVLDTISGQYVLWLRILGDTTWYAKPLTYWTVGSGSLDFLGTISLPHTPDSIDTALVSIEQISLPSSPTSILMTGTFYSGADTAYMSMANAGGAGNYSSATASVIFTTRSSDTNRAKSEFYLMDFIKGVPTSSASNIPVPPPGWSYGLWVLDSNFYPLHKFFYGAFTNPDSSDSSPQTDEFPFPGGFNPAPLNDPGARLEVTLEPDFAISGNHPAGPSPLTILWAQLRRFIDYNDTLNLQNAWSFSAPHGILKVSK